MTDRIITLKDCGELGFIESIKPLMRDHNGKFRRPVGDDCLETEAIHGESILATTDTFIDTVHFAREYFSFEEVGTRCMAASVSDIAAMAGTPLFSLVSLSMPKDFPLDDARALFKGLQDCAAGYGCTLAGGETTSTPGPVTITVTAIGTAIPGNAVYRSGAQAGDSLYVSGTIGDTMAGLMAFQKNIPAFDTLKNKFIAPVARVELARKLADNYKLNAMIDVSDGVATDLRHILEESGVGSEIYADSLPLSDEYCDFASEHIDDPVSFALASGEEFELLFTSNDKNMPAQLNLNGQQITRIGMITDKTGICELVTPDGLKNILASKGYEHFKA